MFTLLHEGEGQRIFQKEELQRQYSNVYFVHKASSHHYTNQAIPNPQLVQGLLLFPENEHMGPSAPSFIPLIGIPPTNFNTPISNEYDVTITEFVTNICKSTLHQHPNDPDNEAPPPGQTLQDHSYPPAAMPPTGRGLLVKRQCPPLLQDKQGNRKDIHVFTTFNKFFTKWLVNQRRPPQDTTNELAARQTIAFLESWGITIMHRGPIQLTTVDFTRGQVFIRIPIFLDPLTPPMDITTAPSLKIYRSDSFE
jgi:hypothetical protein